LKFWQHATDIKDQTLGKVITDLGIAYKFTSHYLPMMVKQLNVYPDLLDTKGML
jgi:hypothetical protein